ncbi:MAG: ABC transporter ATP-binding protein [Crocinitomicaceae bacterium]|nr:ABC transporter ATP-binding protein [Crocinitomicaceae bacterium]
MIDVRLLKMLHGTDGNMQLRFETQIQSGEFVTLYGPSGAGKSTVLRMLAGLTDPEDGYIIANDINWFDKRQKINLRPQLRCVGMVFQEYSLFPNMTVRENLIYALEKGQSDEVVDELLDRMELGQLRLKRPSFLSGGQKQRVALARALVRTPKLLLLDEPLSALDSDIRMRLQDYILEIHHQLHLTTILVSHDYKEVVKMSDRLIVLEGGKIKREGSPDSIFDIALNKSIKY